MIEVHIEAFVRSTILQAYAHFRVSEKSILLINFFALSCGFETLTPSVPPFPRLSSRATDHVPSSVQPTVDDRSTNVDRGSTNVQPTPTLLIHTRGRSNPALI